MRRELQFGVGHTRFFILQSELLKMLDFIDV
jgi:hypothetical protein